MTRWEKLGTRVTDGPITGPVWLQHLVKVLTSTAISFAAWLIFRSHGLTLLGAALLGSYGFFIVLHVIYQIKPSLSGDLTHYDWLNTAGDFLVDMALALVNCVLALLVMGEYAEAIIGVIVLALVYWTFLPWSRP